MAAIRLAVLSQAAINNHWIAAIELVMAICVNGNVGACFCLIAAGRTA